MLIRYNELLIRYNELAIRYNELRVGTKRGAWCARACGSILEDKMRGCGAVWLNVIRK